MQEMHLMGVQKRPAQIFQRGINFGRKIAYAVSAINGIADYRVPYLRHVNANLVGSSGFDANAQKRHGSEILLNDVMRDRRPEFSRACGNFFLFRGSRPRGKRIVPEGGVGFP